MPDVERTVTVDKPLDTVWAYLSDFRTTEEWDPPTVSTVRTSGDGGERLQLKGDAGSIALLDTLTFAATPSGGTAVTYRAEFSPHGAAKLAEPLMPLGLKVLADKVAASMQESLEKL